MPLAYLELVDFIARGSTPSDVIAFQPSEETKAHVADVIHREKTVGISSEETAKLDHYLQLEHVMRLARARAREEFSSQ